jgi:hypothetical protein
MIVPDEVFEEFTTKLEEIFFNCAGALDFSQKRRKLIEESSYEEEDFINTALKKYYEIERNKNREVDQTT